MTEVLKTRRKATNVFDVKYKIKYDGRRSHWEEQPGFGVERDSTGVSQVSTSVILWTSDMPCKFWGAQQCDALNWSTIHSKRIEIHEEGTNTRERLICVCYIKSLQRWFFQCIQTRHNNLTKLPSLSPLEYLPSPFQSLATVVNPYNLHGTNYARM